MQATTNFFCEATDLPDLVEDTADNAQITAEDINSEVIVDEDDSKEDEDDSENNPLVEYKAEALADD